MGNETIDKAQNTRPKTVWKKWLLIALIAILVIIIAVPSALVISMNNSPYDCSFAYNKIDDPVSEIVKKHTYYNALDKTLEIELNQDLLNSLIKDNMASVKLDLPDKVTISELLFNTKDQRLYINAKYGNINVPISAEVTVKTSDSGVEITGGDIKIVKTNAPGFIKNQMPQDSLKFSIKYADFGLPQVFTVKDIKFGSGSIKLTIQLIPEKIVELALGYRNDIVNQVNTFKTSQSEIVATFLTKLMGTDILTDAKVKEYVEQALGNEELVNSAINFAMAPDLNKYADSLKDIQKKVEDWAAPLQVLKYYGSVDETYNKILYDQKLRDMVSWFLPSSEITQYTATAESYYGMYKEYYGMYLDALDAIDRAVTGIKTKDINDFTKQLLDLTAQTEDARIEAKNSLTWLDDSAVSSMVALFEKDGTAAKGYTDDIIAARNDTNEFLGKTYKKDINEFNSVVKNRSDFIVSVIKQLKQKQYEDAVARLAKDGLLNSRTKAYIDKCSGEIDVDGLAAYVEKYY